MAQMPIQMISGRADPFTAASPAVLSSQPRVAIPRAAYLYDPGGISGGKLRPGSIDQEQFKAYLAAARNEAAAAPPTPLAAPSAPPPARGVPSGIPTLSPAQLAALGIDVSQLPSPDAPGPGRGCRARRSGIPGHGRGRRTDGRRCSRPARSRATRSLMRSTRPRPNRPPAKSPTPR